MPRETRREENRSRKSKHERLGPLSTNSVPKPANHHLSVLKPLSLEPRNPRGTTASSELHAVQIPPK